MIEVNVFKSQTGAVISDDSDNIALWMTDTDYNCENSFSFMRHAYFLGAKNPYKSLKTAFRAEIDKQALDSLNSAISRPFPKPDPGRIAVKVINHLGDEVMKIFNVSARRYPQIPVTEGMATRKTSNMTTFAISP